MKIIVDVMGGDNAPLETLSGASEASKLIDDEIIVVGKEDLLKNLAEEQKIDISKLKIVNADDVVSMEDDPIGSVRKKPDSSMMKGLSMLSNGEGDAFVSAGNTGALFSGSYLLVRKLKNIKRPAIGSILPMPNPVLLLDCGANVECEADYLLEFALIGSTYMQNMFGIENPRVGLLNNGSEECKGTPLQKEAYKLLSNDERINFVGNVESNNIPSNVCDVIVADGFTGNILLKSIEGIGKLVITEVKGIFKSNLIGKICALCLKNKLLNFKKKYDSSETGGSLILGVKKPVIKAHGSSNAKAFKNAIIRASEFAKSNFIEKLEEKFDK